MPQKLRELIKADLAILPDAELTAIDGGWKAYLFEKIRPYFYSGEHHIRS